MVRHRGPALRVAYALVGSDAEDVVQDAFVKAHRSLGRFRQDAPFAPWLLRIVANEASNRRRAAGRRAAVALRVAAGGRRSGDAAPSPEEAAVAAERRAVLAAAMSRLSEGDRLVLACRWFAQLSEQETATVLGCRPGTVKSRLSRAMDRLRAELPPGRFDG